APDGDDIAHLRQGIPGTDAAAAQLRWAHIDKRDAGNLPDGLPSGALERAAGAGAGKTKGDVTAANPEIPHGPRADQGGAGGRVIDAGERPEDRRLGYA